ncbi:MAG: alpha/beta fold hydrolase [Hyphomicrobiales bacterium]
MPNFVTSKLPSIIVVLVMAVFLSACAGIPRDVIGVGAEHIATAEQKGSTVRTIYIATTRQKSESKLEYFSGERSQALQLGSIDVSIPQAHEEGKIERLKGKTIDPQKHFILSTPSLHENGTSFQAQLNNQLASLPSDERDILVFVHGYNTNFSAAVLRVAQFVHDTGYKGIPVLFSWASRGSTLDYLYDLNSALQSRDALVRLGVILNEVNASHFDVVAHSMGNLVTLEAMRTLELHYGDGASRRLRHVILASPDIDVDFFKTQLTSVSKVQDRFTVLVSKDDRALNLSRRLAGGVSRVGATDPLEIAKLGLKVIDLTDIEERSSTNHTKFASSPDIVQLIGRGLKAGNTLSAQTTPSAIKTVVGGIAKGVTIIPTSLLNGAQAAVISVGN